MKRNLDLNVAVRSCRECQLGGLRVARGGIAAPAFPGPEYAPGGIALIGAQPGGWEEVTGLPLAGPVSNMLDSILEEAGVARESLLILNLLSCAIPRGEGPQDYPDAYGNCRQHVDAALDHYNPRVVMLMGSEPIKTVFGATAKVGMTRGVSRTTGGRTYIATYHPGAILRSDAGPDLFQWCVEDWQLAAVRLREINDGRA